MKFQIHCTKAGIVNIGSTFRQSKIKAYFDSIENYTDVCKAIITIPSTTSRLSISALVELIKSVDGVKDVEQLAT